jgi:hypothetical protein
VNVNDEIEIRGQLFRYALVISFNADLKEIRDLFCVSLTFDDNFDLLHTASASRDREEL